MTAHTTERIRDGKQEGLLNAWVVFCTGRCGSTYLVDLLRENGVPAWHEKPPDLYGAHQKAIQGTLTEEDQNRIRYVLQNTHSLPGVFVNSRLSAFPRLVEEALRPVMEDRLSYAHLHRDARWAVTSQARAALDEALVPVYGGEDRFEAACRWWADCTSRILCFLRTREHVVIRFEDLVQGRHEAIEQMVGQAITAEGVGNRNRTSDSLAHRCPEPHEWTGYHEDTYERICQPWNRELGYDL